MEVVEKNDEKISGSWFPLKVRLLNKKNEDPEGEIKIVDTPDELVNRGAFRVLETRVEKGE